MVLYKFEKPEFVQRQLEKLQASVLGRKSFFLFVHAHYCSHCVKMQPEWRKLRRNLPKDMPIVEIESGAMHTLLRDFPHNDLSSVLKKAVAFYPTIAYVEQKKRPQKLIVHVFQGERTMPHMLAFLQENRVRVAI